VGVKGCLRGAKVSHRAKASRQPKPEHKVPITVGSDEARVVV
jgi:hypothetical protein